nr:Uncharacterised protein [Raoultella sp. NCTC 9187]
MRCKGIQLAGYAVVKTRAYRNQQVALLNRQVSRLRPVHAQHPQVIGIVSINRAQPLQRAGRRHLRDRNKLAQSGHRLRHTDAAADVQHRLLRLSQHLQRLLNLGVRESNVIGYRGKIGFELTCCQLDIFRNVYQYRGLGGLSSQPGKLQQ